MLTSSTLLLLNLLTATRMQAKACSNCYSIQVRMERLSEWSKQLRPSFSSNGVRPRHLSCFSTKSSPFRTMSLLLRTGQKIRSSAMVALSNVPSAFCLVCISWLGHPQARQLLSARVLLLGRRANPFARQGTLTDWAPPPTADLSTSNLLLLLCVGEHPSSSHLFFKPCSAALVLSMLQRTLEPIFGASVTGAA